jgi:protein O-GlcNAc transferase
VDLKALFQKALAAHQAGNLAQAEDLYARLLALRPGHAQVTYLLGALRASQGRSAEAVQLLEAALAAQPENPAILLHLGNALQDQKRFEEALARYDQALQHKSAYADALNNRGNALVALDRLDEALASFDAALAIRTDDSGTWYNRGIALQKALQPQQAIASFDQALTIRPDLAEGWNNKGSAWLSLKKPDRALPCFEQALAIQPQNPEFVMNRGSALQLLKRHAEALAAYDRVMALDPDFPHAWGEAAKTALYLCDWARIREMAQEMPARIRSGAAVHPWVLLSYNDDGALQRHCAQSAISEVVPQTPPPLWRGEDYRHDRIRLAYLSYDFRAHPVGYQIVELLERHDRSRFEVIAISAGPRENSDIHRRIEAACDQFHHVHDDNVRSIAERIRRLEVDVAVDLGGFTEGSSMIALAHRPHRCKLPGWVMPELPARISSMLSLPTRSPCRHRSRPSILNRLCICRTVFSPWTRRASSDRPRHEPRQACPKTALYFAGSTTTSRLLQRCSTSGCGCCSRFPAASCGCGTASRTRCAARRARVASRWNA